MLIRLRAGDHVFSAEALEHAEFTSLSTGASLHRIKISFDTPNLAQRNSIEKFDGPLFALDAKGEPMREFRAAARSSSVAQGSSHTTFQWELFEQEKLKLEGLKINGLTVIPQDYTESFESDGTLAIKAHVQLQSSEYAQFRALPDSFPVVRVGINEQPREMRLGTIYWSKHDELYKIALVLVDHGPDDAVSQNASLGAHFYQSYPAMARNAARLEALFDTLERKGILSKIEADAARVPPEDKVIGHYYELHRVPDAEKW